MTHTILPTLILFCAINALSQSYVKVDHKIESKDSISISAKYVDSRINKLTTFSKRNERKAKRLLSRLSKKEKHFLSKVKKQDTLLYAQLKDQVGFDSLKSLAGSKSNQFKKTTSSLSSSVDSLKHIYEFANDKLNSTEANFNSLGIQSSKLKEINQLQEKLDYNQAIDNQIQSITSRYKGIAGKFNLGNIKGIEKQSFYYQQQIKSWKNIAKDPSILEEKALNYLKGMQGFEEQFSNPSVSLSSNTSSMPMNANAEELEKMGYQTKRQVNKQLNSQLGIGNSSEKLQEINLQVKEQVNELKKVNQEIKSAKTKIHSLQKPSFKINPMRGLPLKLRIEKSLNWQVLKANGDKPVIIEFNTQVGFKHNKILTYNLVAGGSLGLGKDWQHLGLSFQGLRVGANTDIKMIWGISGQVGYERFYKNYEQTKLIPSSDALPQQLVTTTKRYRDIAFCGIQKKYKLNSKYYGTMLLAYDFLWKHGNANSPVIWRFGWQL